MTLKEATSIMGRIAPRGSKEYEAVIEYCWVSLLAGVLIGFGVAIAAL